MVDVWEIVRRGLGAPARVEEEEEEEKMEVDEPVVEEEIKVDAEENDDDDEDEELVVVASTSTTPVTPSIVDKPFTLPRNLRTTPQTRRLLGSAFAFLVRKARSTVVTDQEEGELEQLFRMMIEDVAEVEEMDEGVRMSRNRGAKGRGKGNGKGRGQEEGSSKMLAEGVTWVTVETCSVSFLCLLSPCLV